MRKLLVSVLLVAALALVGNSIADAAPVAPAFLDDLQSHQP
jgi:hypothetical protein